MALGRFVNVHEVPLMVVLSVQSHLHVDDRHHLEPLSQPWRVDFDRRGLVVANFIVSAIFTRIVTTPLKPIMRGLKKEWDDAGPIIGNAGIVKTSEVSETFGQVEILRQGAPTLCTARTPEGCEPIKRGETALVIDYNTETQTCIVKRLEGDQLEI